MLGLMPFDLFVRYYLVVFCFFLKSEAGIRFKGILLEFRRVLFRSRNPNVGGVLMAGLGCEMNQIDWLVEAYGLKPGPLFQSMNIQDVGGLRKSIELGIQKIEKMLPVVNEATRREVDPVLDRPAAVKKYGKDPEKMANWEQVRSDYEALVNASPAVVRIYATMRNLFRGLRNDIRNAVDERLTIAIPDGAVRARVMKSFYDKLTSKGTIEPYTPLEREGDLWLYYNAIDPLTGNLERYAESFTTPAARARAWSEIQGKVRDDIRGNQKLMSSMTELVRQKKHANIEEAIDAQIGVTEAASISEVNFNNAPPASFIAQLTKQIRENSPSDTKEQRETTNKIINEIGELVLNTIPETSYMQSFRTRKGTLGNIEDAIRATTKRATLLGRQAVQMKYGNKFDSIKVELKAAYDAAGGEGNTTPAMRDMYDTLVSFADSGTGVNRSNFS